MFIVRLDKSTKREKLLTVDELLKEVEVTLGDTTKHKKLETLAALIDGAMPQNSEVAYYIREARA